MDTMTRTSGRFTLIAAAYVALGLLICGCGADSGGNDGGTPGPAQPPIPGEGRIPIVTGISPVEGPDLGGTAVTVTGENFASSATGVTILLGGTPASIVSASQTQIVITAPAHIAGIVDMDIRTPRGRLIFDEAFRFVVPVPTITSVTPDNGVDIGGTPVTIVGTHFRSPLTVTFGGTPAASLTVNSETQISAVAPPTSLVGLTDITVTTAGGIAEAPFTYTAMIWPPIEISTVLPQGIEGQRFGPVVFTAIGGTGAGYTWDAWGNFPTGLNLYFGPNADSLTLDGVLAASGILGTYDFTVKVADSGTNVIGTQFTLTVRAFRPLLIQPAFQPLALPVATEGVTYLPYQLEADGGTLTGYDWKVAPGSTLPTGMTLSASGVLGGSPQIGNAGSRSFYVEVYDSGANYDFKLLNLDIVASGTAMVVDAQTLENAVETIAYSGARFRATGGVGPTYSWTVTGGDHVPPLPAGMSLDAATGDLVGTPAQGTVGTYTFTVQVTAVGGGSDTESFSLSVDRQATVSTVAGGPASGAGPAGDGGPALGASFFIATGVAVDAAGNMFIADQRNHRIRKVDATTKIITSVVGDGTQSSTGDGGLGTAATTAFPTDVAVDAAGNVYFCEFLTAKVRKLTPAGNVSLVGTLPDGFALPTGIAVTAAGDKVYCASIALNVVFEVNAASGNTGIVAGISLLGTGGHSGDGGPATAANICQPYGVCVDSVGDLYIADRGSNCVRKVVMSTGIITTIAGVPGNAGYTGNGGSATQAYLCGPTDIAVDANGDVFIMEGNDTTTAQTSCTVRKVKKNTGTIVAVAGTPFIRGYTGDGGLASQCTFNFTYGNMCLDATGDLYLTDVWNKRIRKITNP